MPWISRASHQQIVSLLSAQLDDLKQERKVLLDRLATLGLGGPLFDIPEPVEQQEVKDEEEDDLSELLALRKRPTKLADALTRKSYRDYAKNQTGPKVKWIPKVDNITAALDEAEKQGKEQAS